jgi:hypothetical protein
MLASVGSQGAFEIGKNASHARRAVVAVAALSLPLAIASLGSPSGLFRRRNPCEEGSTEIAASSGARSACILDLSYDAYDFGLMLHCTLQLISESDGPA